MSDRSLLAGLSACAFLFSSVTVAWASPVQVGSPPSSYWYRDVEVPLELDGSQIAVHAREQVTDSELAAVLRGADLKSLGIVQTGHRLCRLVQLASPAQSAEGVAEALTRALRLDVVSFASPVFLGSGGGHIIPTPNIVVRLKGEYGGIAQQVLSDLAPDLPVIRQYPGSLPATFMLNVPSGQGFDVLTAANRLAQDPRTAWAEPDFQMSTVSELHPNDPLLPSQWALESIQAGSVYFDVSATKAWDVEQGIPGIGVLVLDTGVQMPDGLAQTAHPDLVVAKGRDFTTGVIGGIDGGWPVLSSDNHGTAVAGCVGATLDNGIGVAGIAPGCSLLSARIAAPSETIDMVVSHLVEALDWGRIEGARVTNFSGSLTGGPSALLEDAYELMHQAHGMVHFAAAGNNDSPAGSLKYPASASIVNGVSGIDVFGGPWANSEYGAGLAFSGPALSIWTTDRTGADGYGSGDYGARSGTSYATPYAAGVAALVHSHGFKLTADEVEWTMQRTAHDLVNFLLGIQELVGYDTLFGHGLPSAYSALKYPMRAMSVDSNNVPLPGPSHSPSLSRDGRFVVFQNGSAIYLSDRATAETKRMDVDPSALPGNGVSSVLTDGAISADGRFVVFHTTANNLTPTNPDPNSLNDIYLHDRNADGDPIYDEFQAIQNYRLSIGHDGSASDGHSYDAAISPDGRYVAFRSLATNLVPGYVQEDPVEVFTAAYLHDVQTGVTEIVSVGPSGFPREGLDPVVANDGTVAFISTYPLFGGDSNDTLQVFVKSPGAALQLASFSQFGGYGNGSSFGPSITDDGRHVAFASAATNLHPLDTNGATDVFSLDRQTGSLALVSVAYNDALAFGSSFEPSMSATGRFVAFESTAANLIPADTNGKRDVFLRDRDADEDGVFDEFGVGGSTTLISLTSSGDQGGNTSEAASIAVSVLQDHTSTQFPQPVSPAVLVAFSSLAGNLAAPNGSGNYDIFLQQGAPCRAPAIVAQPQDVSVTCAPLVLKVDATGTGLKYQWRQDDVDIEEGRHPWLHLIDYCADAAGDYDVRVSNDCGSVVSQVATVTVMPTALDSSYGTGWPGTLGVPTLTASAPPKMGEMIDIQLGNSVGVTTFGAFYLGFQPESLLTPKGGTLLVKSPYLFTANLPIFWPFTPVPFDIPCQSIFCGLTMYMQTLQLDPGASHEISFSPGLELTLGL